jgi:hypothetical protein
MKSQSRKTFPVLFAVLVQRVKGPLCIPEFWIELKRLLISDPGFRNAVGLLQNLA